MKFSEKQLKIFTIAFFLLLYAFFYWYKISKYDLFYYQHDLFSVLSSARGWIFGHPLWYDNRYGFTPAVHFSFIAPLLSPFTIFAGGKGLFLAHILIYFFAFYFMLYSKTGKGRSARNVPVLIIFFMSPYALWIFDDSYFGWHIELLFLPLSVFFALALLSKKWPLIIVSALLLILTKEDGCVIACCIQLLFIFSENSHKPINWKQVLKSISAWLAIFILCLLVIKYFNDFKPSRIEITLSEFYQDERFFNGAYFRKILWHFMVLLFPLLIISFFLLGRRNFLMLLLFMIPVIVTGIVSGLWYSGNTYFSISWEPRFVEIMGVMLAGIFILLNDQPEEHSFRHKLKLAMATLGVLVLQGISLAIARDYNMFTEISHAAGSKLPEKINSNDVAIMKCIAAKTPRDFNVAVPYEFFSLFDHNDLTWFDGIQNAPQKNPDLVILDDTLKFAENKFDYGEYSNERKGKFYILLRKDKAFLNYDCK